jgi:hypothetical protein
MNEQLEANRSDDLPKLDPHWNYRVVRKIREHNGTKWITFGIHEVYYRDGEPAMVTVDPVDPHGETFEELKEDLEWHNRALEKPVLKYEDIGSEGTDTEATT